MKDNTNYVIHTEHVQSDQMKKITLEELYAFLRDPSVPSLIAQIADRYISLTKVPVGDAVMVYGFDGYTPDFIENMEAKYSLVAIVSGDGIYIKHMFFFYGFDRPKDSSFISNFNDYVAWFDSRTPGVMAFETYVKWLNVQATALYCKWYDTLSYSLESVKEKEFECAENARKIAVMSGSNDESMLKAPDLGYCILNNMDAFHILIGSTTLEKVFGKWTDEHTSTFQSSKALRMRTQEILRSGKCLTGECLRMADAIRTIDAQFVNVQFEHEGAVASGKLKLKTLQGAIVRTSIPYYASCFSTEKEGNMIREKMMGNKWADIPINFVQSVSFRGKAVYVHKDND